MLACSPVLSRNAARRPLRARLLLPLLALVSTAACSSDPASSTGTTGGTGAGGSGTGGSAAGGGGMGGAPSCEPGAHPAAEGACESSLASWSVGPGLMAKRDHHATFVAEGMDVTTGGAR